MTRRLEKECIQSGLDPGPFQGDGVVNPGRLEGLQQHCSDPGTSKGSLSHQSNEKRAFLTDCFEISIH